MPAREVETIGGLRFTVTNPGGDTSKARSWSLLDIFLAIHITTMGERGTFKIEVSSLVDILMREFPGHKITPRGFEDGVVEIRVPLERWRLEQEMTRMAARLRRHLVLVETDGYA